MPKLVVRLYGRFTYAVASANGGLTGEISAIAPRFSSPFDEHKPLMSIARSAIALGQTLTDLPPTYKMVSDAPDVIAAETFVWELAGLDVGFMTDPNRGPSPSATLGLAERDRVIPDLGALVEQIKGTPVLATESLSASKNGRASAVINITEGRGVAKMALETDNAFLIPRGVADNNPDPDPETLKKLLTTEHNRRIVDGVTAPFKKADVVEFVIEIQRNKTFTFTLVNPVDGDGTVHHVSVVAKEADATIFVNFSNLCSTIPMEEVYDLEFAQYYNLLTRDPGHEALILVPTDDGGEPGECSSKSRITYEKGKTG